MTISKSPKLRKRRTTDQRKPRRPQIETLEQKKLMATMAFHWGEDLYVFADASGSQVDIWEGQEISWQSGTVESRLYVKTNSSNETAKVSSFDRDEISRILFFGSDSSDAISNRTGVKSELYGNGGNDVMSGGRGADYMDGGAGNDLLHGQGGNDQVIGRTGRDHLQGGDGDDKLYGGRDNDLMWGGRGNDSLYGYSGNDFLDGGKDDDDLNGEQGRDAIYGGDGDDVLRGGDDEDMLYGGRDDDTLSGGGGNDVLYGYSGHDNLYGGPGVDRLFGDSGNDGLYGGGAYDMVFGGTGADRFLTSPHQLVFDATAEDATIALTGPWTEVEATAVDRALALLHHETGNTRLLKTESLGNLTFERARGWDKDADNNSRGHLRFFDWSFTELNSVNQKFFSTAKTATIVFHEIGHNWEDEGPNWQEFLALSGWTKTNPNDPSRFARIDKYGETWWFRKSAKFVTSYAQSHPLDDYADSFAAYFVSKTGMPFKNNPTIVGADSIPDKIKVIEKSLAALKA